MRVVRNTNSPEDALPSKKGRSIVSPPLPLPSPFLFVLTEFPLEKKNESKGKI